MYDLTQYDSEIIVCGKQRDDNKIEVAENYHVWLAASGAKRRIKRFYPLNIDRREGKYFSLKMCQESPKLFYSATAATTYSTLSLFSYEYP